MDRRKVPKESTEKQKRKRKTQLRDGWISLVIKGLLQKEKLNYMYWYRGREVQPKKKKGEKRTKKQKKSARSVARSRRELAS